MNKKYQLQIYEEIQKRQSLWNNIANRSGEHSVEDVMIEAWLFTCESWKLSKFFQIDNEGDWKYLYGAIYKKLIQYSEKNVKYGVQIDQPYVQNSFEENEHPVLRQLFADEYLEPLKQLEKLEEQQEYEQDFNQKIELLGYSKLSAFLLLSHSFNTSRIQTAQYMNMSYSWFYRSGQIFQNIYNMQNSLFDEIDTKIQLEQLRTWRKFRIILCKNLVSTRQLNLCF
ncbi:MAG: hypothetical protein RR575_11370 [Acinetobacter sp.]